MVIRDDRRNRIAERLPSRVQWYLVEDQLLWERCSTGRPAARTAAERSEDELTRAGASFALTTNHTSSPGRRASSATAAGGSRRRRARGSSSRTASLLISDTTHCGPHPHPRKR